MYMAAVKRAKTMMRNARLSEGIQGGAALLFGWAKEEDAVSARSPPDCQGRPPNTLGWRLPGRELRRGQRARDRSERPSPPLEINEETGVPVDPALGLCDGAVGVELLLVAGAAAEADGLVACAKSGGVAHV